MIEILYLRAPLKKVFGKLSMKQILAGILVGQEVDWWLEMVDRCYTPCTSI